MKNIKRNLIGALVALAMVGCSGQVSQSGQPDAPSATGSLNTSCGVANGCAKGLECLNELCTFECGYKYSTEGDYGFDQASADQCINLGGSCQELQGVSINRCVFPF